MLRRAEQSGGDRAPLPDPYPDFVPLAPTLVDGLPAQPVGLLGTVHAAPGIRRSVGLLGDAAHAIVPFYGQGANCAFEDIVELDRCLDETSGNWTAALPLYEAPRAKHRGDRRDGAGQLRRDAWPGRLADVPARQANRAWSGACASGYLLSRYELVSFTTTPPRCGRRVRLQHGALLGVAVTAALAAATTIGRMRK